MKIRDQTLINYYVVVPSALRTNLQTAESLEIIIHILLIPPYLSGGQAGLCICLCPQLWLCQCLCNSVRDFLSLSSSRITSSWFPDHSLTLLLPLLPRPRNRIILFLDVGLFANMLRWMDFSQACRLSWANYSFITLQSLYHCFPVPVFLNLKKYIFWLDFCFSVPLVTEVFVHQ